MPPKGKESFIRRQKEIARQQKAKEKREKREKKGVSPRLPGQNKGDISPDEMGSLEDIIGPIDNTDGDDADGDAADEAATAEGSSKEQGA